MSPQTRTQNIGKDISAAGVKAGQQIAMRLTEAGFRTVAQVRKAPDDALLDVSGIGPAALMAIRKATA